MKKKDKKFLASCNDDKENQLCYEYERKSAERLLDKGFIKTIKDNDDQRFEADGEFFIYLTKKGVKRVKKYKKKFTKRNI